MFRKLAVLVSVTLGLLAFGCSDEDCPTCNGDGPVLTVNKHSVNFGATSTTATFVISNAGSGNLAWDLTPQYRFAAAKQAGPAHGGWLELSTTEGEGDATITLTANRAELDELGASKAVIIINAPQAVNMTLDSIVVYVLNGGEWLITDDGGFEDCWQVDALDYYWVKGFEMPHGQSQVFVDSVAINFCEGDSIVQLLAYDAIFEEDIDVYAPNNALAVSNAFYLVDAGWNTIAVDWYMPAGPVFYIGYFQLGSGRPDLSIDNTSDGDTLCWRARDVSTTPGESVLEWQWQPEFETFGIRVFVTPVLEYNPKMVAQQSQDEIEATLKTGFAYKGRYPMNIKPALPR